jgi:hypothetical protein
MYASKQRGQEWLKPSALTEKAHPFNAETDSFRFAFFKNGTEADFVSSKKERCGIGSAV